MHARTPILIASLLIFFLLAQLFIFPLLALNSRLGNALAAPGILLRSLALRASLVRNLNALSLENQSLRAQIFQLKNQAQIIQSNPAYLHARLFSQYPFNDNSLIYIAAGKRHQVEEGQAVLAEPGIFLGQIQQVQKNYSSARTIFSPGWELPVKISDKGIDGLLIGSNQPKITLISKSQNPQPGDLVSLASPNFPIALTIGVIESISDSDSDLFQEATLTLPYNLSELQKIYIQFDE